MQYSGIIVNTRERKNRLKKKENRLENILRIYGKNKKNLNKKKKTFFLLISSICYASFFNDYFYFIFFGTF